MAPRLLAAALTLAATVAATATAAAAPAVTNLAAAPKDPSAGAHSDMTVSFDLTGLGPAGSGGDDLRSLRLDLPPGLVGNPLATGGTCSSQQLHDDACPASTRVGSTTVVADAVLLDTVDLGEQTIPGDLYNVATAGPEAARLGIVLRPALSMPKVILESPAVLRSSDGGLTSTVDGIPNTSSTPAGDVPLRIDHMSLTLDAAAPSGTPFETNPTSCAAAPTTVTIGTYGGQSAAATAGFTPTACDRLAFAPKLSASIGAGRDDLRPGAHPAVTVTVSQAAGEANARTVAVTLPPGIGTNFTGLGGACALTSFQAGSCPAASIVGDATAYSPLLAAPLRGTVTLVAAPGVLLPQLRVALRGAIALDLTGNVSFGAGNRLVNTFDGIFDLPLSRFVLAVHAGAGSPLAVVADLCDPGMATLDGTFAAHSGAHARAQADAATTGCAAIAAPRLSARVRHLRSGRPTISLLAASADRAMTALTIRLPRGLGFTARARALTTLKLTGTDGHAHVSARGTRMVVRMPSGGATAVGISLRAGALRVSAGLRHARRPRVTLRVDVARQRLTTRRVTVRARLG